jgi:hypothetical protein
MGWDKVKDVLGKAAPLVGGLLGGPVGGSVGALVANVLGVDNDPDQVLQELKNNPDALVKIKTLESEERIALRKLAVEAAGNELAADTSRIKAINATMQSEAKSEKWPQWSWRPFNGFLFGTTIFCVYFILPLSDLPPPSVPSEIWMGWGAILGVSAWHRGAHKRVVDGDKSMSASISDSVKSRRSAS